MGWLFISILTKTLFRLIFSRWLLLPRKSWWRFATPSASCARLRRPFCSRLSTASSEIRKSTDTTTPSSSFSSSPSTLKTRYLKGTLLPVEMCFTNFFKEDLNIWMLLVCVIAKTSLITYYLDGGHLIKILLIEMRIIKIIFIGFIGSLKNWSIVIRQIALRRFDMDSEKLSFLF